MNHTDDKHRYHPYYQTTDYNDNFRQQYKHHYQYASDRLNNNNNQVDFSSQQSQSNTYSYFSVPPPPPPPPPVPLMSNRIIPPSTLVTGIPQERESWIRSVKKTKLNESIEQKTQYLETMLRMPQQQKSSMNSSTFDRIRFANDQLPTTMKPIENNNNHNLDENSFHFIGDINNHDEICTIEQILFDNELQSNTRQCSNQVLFFHFYLHSDFILSILKNNVLLFEI